MKWLSNIAVICLVAASAHAVEIPGPDGNPGNLARLLQNPAVIREIGLSEEQASAAKRTSQQVLEKHRQAFADAWALGPGQQRRVKVGEVFLSVTNDTFAELQSVLEPAQLTRLKQIELQFFGARALGRPNVVAVLELTPEQQRDFLKLASEFGEKLGSAFGDQELSPHQREEKRAALRAEAAREIRNRLTDKQRPAWDQLLGEPFQP